MTTGMLWFDDDPKRSLDDKLTRAAKRYTEKRGYAPTLVHMNPVTAAAAWENGETKCSAGMTVKVSKSIQPNHFWLGRDRSPAE